MKEVLITSSTLIAALLLLRLFFRNTVSRRVQYALWALVLARLLIPVSLPAMPLSVLTAVQRPQAAVARSMERPVYVLPVDRDSAANYPQAAQARPGEPVPTGGSFGYSVLSQDGQSVTRYARRLTVGQLLTRVWLAGAAAMAAFFLAENLRFWRRLRRGRTPYPVAGYAYPVYLCEGIPSPCLFGFPRPAVYLTGAAVSSSERLRHVLAHEETHARHLDPLWSLLRCAYLAAYWFNPLVWAAAAVSRTDCELACDEGTLLRLGEDERIPYGQTLLALIPVRRGPVNPLLAATAMTAGKRQLKDRLLRIAQRRRTLTAALAAVIALALAVGACTFTGAKNADTGPQPLTGEELRWFNEDFFNGESLNIRNQFLSSHYKTSEEIDLYQLFYCDIPAGEPGGGTPFTLDEEELRLAFGGGEGECARYRLSTTDMDALLKKYTGLTVEETKKVGLDSFTYLASYDAYYFEHGDTNYRYSVAISAGQREGDTVRLYYEDDFGILGGGWNCVTLRETQGGYRFVSNQPAEKPKIPIVLPDGKPELTISLDGLTPYEAPAVTVERHIDDCVEWLDNWRVGSFYVRTYRSTDGNLYAAVVYRSEGGNGALTAWDANVFLTLDSEDSAQITTFSDLFGQRGFIVTYFGQRSETNGTTFHDYYYLTEDGTPVLLARAYGDDILIDLDGDSDRELVSGDQIFFTRGGKLYMADLPALVHTIWPEMNFWDYAIWDPYSRCLTITGLLDMPGWADGGASFQRCLYFDGDRLLLYKDGATANHVLEGVSAPDAVLAEAKARAESAYRAIKAGEKDTLADQDFDDWRIRSLTRVNIGEILAHWPGLEVAVYRFNYELHSAAPEKVRVAGGAYVNEDGWFGGFWSAQSPYLLFQIKDGAYHLLESAISGDGDTGSPFFQRELTAALEQNGLLPSEETGLKAQALLSKIAAGERVALTLTTADGAGGGRYEVPPQDGNGPNRVLNFDTAFRWAYTSNHMDAGGQSRDSLTVASPDGSVSLQCWRGSDLVFCRMDGEEFWLSAWNLHDDVVFDGTVFSYLRFWYDEAEIAGMPAAAVIPDRGQSHQEIAQAWVDAVTGVNLRVTPGSKYACTYVRAIATVDEDFPDELFPKDTQGMERFYFSYTRIFVPENEVSYRWQMAGNTVEYDGSHGEAPEGAMMNFLMGPMYLSPDGWRCDGVGTG